MELILALNPGSTSTKVGLFSAAECLFKESLRHIERSASAATNREEEAQIRRKAVTGLLAAKRVPLQNLAALVVRGGLLKPLPSGTYLVDENIYNDLLSARYGWHASNLGAIIALPLSRELGIPLYTTDPVTVDELEPPARFSGLKNIERLSMSHALNMKAVARLVAEKFNKRYEDLNFVVVHLGSGISVSAHRRGRMIDVNNANEEGPFSMERCGSLPAPALVRLCFESGHTCAEIIKMLTSEGGVYSYLGTKDFTAVQKMSEDGSLEAREVVEAMIYQVAKETAAMAAVLDGEVDHIILTGGMAYSKMFTGALAEKVRFIAPVEIHPGEEELEALAAGALRVLKGEAAALIY